MAESFPVLIVFEVWSPPPPSDFRIIVTGSIPQLGKWFMEKPISMDRQEDGAWKRTVEVNSNDEFEYKYACYSNQEGRCVGYEQGTNRHLSVSAKLAEEETFDPQSGLPLILVKDIWSAAGSDQIGRGALDPRSRPPGYYQPYGQVLPQQAISDSARMLQRSVMSRSPSASVSGAPNGTADSINQRLAKVASEVATLKKKLKESQTEQTRLKRDHESEMERLETRVSQQKLDSHTESLRLKREHEAEIERLQTKINQQKHDLSFLEKRLEQTRADKEETNSSAVTRELERIAQEHSAQLERLSQEYKALQAQSSTLKDQLQVATREREEFRESLKRTEADSARTLAEVESLRAIASDATENRELLQAVDRVLMSRAGEALRDPSTVLDEELSLDERLDILIEELMARKGSVDTGLLRTMWDVCLEMKATLSKTRDSVKRDVSRKVTEAMRVIETELKRFLKGQSEVIQVYVERYQKQYNERKRLANEIVDLKGKIRVFGRARPFLKREIDLGHVNVLAFPESDKLLVGLGAERYMMSNDVTLGAEAAMGENKIDDVKMYQLDHIFAPTASQEEVFEEVRHLIGSVLDGYNVTVFAYGQTGSGKTHTMDGTADDPGITIRSLGLFFNPQSRQDAKLSANQQSIRVWVSMLEIYNEEVRDLLDTSTGKKDKLEVRQTPDGGSCVPNLLRREAATLRDALDIIDQGRENRVTAETKMNSQSSRSHMVFTAYLEVTNPLTKDKLSSKLHLVDLAGSERVSKSKATGDQLTEARNINKSLSALGDVIAALTARSGNSNTHVPYRNSKLTFLLQDSLCGHSRTAMFVNMSPSSDNFWETISTLNFGARAASVELGQVQKHFQSGEIAQLHESLAKLQSQLQQQRGQAGTASTSVAQARDQVSQLEKEIETRDKKQRLMQKQLDDLRLEFEKSQEALRDRQEKSRAELRERDEKIRELEETSRKSRKEQLTARGTDDGHQKEVAALRKQVVELQKLVVQADTKVATADSRARKFERALAVSAEEVKALKDQMKSKDKTKFEAPDSARQRSSSIKMLRSVQPSPRSDEDNLEEKEAASPKGDGGTNGAAVLEDDDLVTPRRPNPIIPSPVIRMQMASPRNIREQAQAVRSARSTSATSVTRMAAYRAESPLTRTASPSPRRNERHASPLPLRTASPRRPSVRDLKQPGIP
eukprot:c19851_g1_i1.p1 GENE.c19851_g1_i1~~c19851_g1_i1.p1  ORF type:complete len:1217 (+),score=220.68 c19851_g1_i1:108-3653(+)